MRRAEYLRCGCGVYRSDPSCRKSWITICEDHSIDGAEMTLPCLTANVTDDLLDQVAHARELRDYADKVEHRNVRTIVLVACVMITMFVIGIVTADWTVCAGPEAPDWLATHVLECGP